MGKTVTQIESEPAKTPSCKVALVEAEDVDMVWDEVSPLIEKALRHAEGELIPNDIKKHLDASNLRLWVALENRDVIAAMVTEIIQYPRKKIVRVITLAGKDMSMWYKFLPRFHPDSSRFHLRTLYRPSVVWLVLYE